LGLIKEFGDETMETIRYMQLFRATEKFHSTLDKDIVLGEISLTLQEIFPDFSYYLFLSQDNYNQSELPIMDLEYDSENVAAINAYVSGNIQMEQSIAEKCSILYAPLKGKQGIYGVLQIIAQNTLEFPNNDEVEFITLLAGTAGNALENAQLYQQSRQLIADLQLINETSHCLNSNLRLAETMTYMTKQIIRSFKAQEVGFFLLTDERDRPKVLPGSTPFFLSKQARIYIDHIKDKIQTENESLFWGDINLIKGGNIPNFHSIMAIPIIQSENIRGFSIVMHQQPYYFSFDTFKLLQELVHHSALALTNSMLREELEKMVITDHLTKLHSRKFLDEKIQRSMIEDMEGTFILLDIDNFKEINDTFGHQVGDEVLKQVANIMKGNIRGNDVGARWGGEELAIYLPSIPLESGVDVAERLVERVADCSNPHITVSCGVSSWNKERHDSYNYLFKRADEALYIAKGTGKNKVVTECDSIKAS
jgi:two-component system cell cycle response regulator